MGSFNRLMMRCMQLSPLRRQGGPTRCLPTLTISRPYHHNHQGGSPSPSSNNLQPQSLSPTDCYLFLHQPATTRYSEKSTRKVQGEEEEEEEAPTLDNCPDRLYSLSAAGTTCSKKNINEDHQLLNIIKNHNRLHVDLANSRCLGSSRGWLLFVNRTTLALHLLNPFHANPPIIPLPAIESLPFVIRSVTRHKSPSTTTDDSVGGAYSPHGCFNSSTEFLLSDVLNPVSSKDMMIPADQKGGVSKFAISSNPLASSGSNCYDDDCIIMILCNNHQLAFWRLGEDKKWTVLSGYPKLRNYHELMYSSKDKLFYAICDGAIEAWDLHTDPSSPKRQYFRQSKGFWDSFYSYVSRKSYNLKPKMAIDLASDSHSDKLLMLLWYSVWDGHEVGFEVFKLEFDEHNEYKHTPVDDLGDRALLLDHNQATFVSTSQFQNVLKPNSIYYIHGRHDKGSDLYNMSVGGAGFAFSLGDRSAVAPLFPSITNNIPKNGASWVIPPDAVL